MQIEKRDEKLSRLYYYSLFFIVITLPFQRFIPPSYALGGIGLIWIFSKGWNRIHATFRKLLLPLAAFFLTVIGLELFQSQSIDATVQLLPFFLFPLFLSIDYLNSKDFWRILIAFSVSCNLALIFDLIVGVSNMIEHWDDWNAVPAINYLFYRKLSYLIPEQAHYFALYLTFAFFISLYKSSDRWTKFKFDPIWGSSALFQLIGIILLAAKAQLLALIFVFLFGALYWALKTSKWRQFAYIITFFGVVLAGLISFSPRTNNRVIGFTESLIQKLNSDNKNIPPRLYVWNNCMKSVQDDFIFGAGVHSVYPKIWEMAEKDVDSLYLLTDALEIANAEHPLKHRILDHLLIEEKEELVWMKEKLAWLPPNEKRQIPIKDSSSTKSIYRLSTSGNMRSKGGIQVMSGNERVLGMRDALADPISSTAYFRANGKNLSLREAPYTENEIMIDKMWIFEYPEIHTNGKKPKELFWVAAESLIMKYKSHNQYLDIILRFGILGFVIFVWLLLTLALEAYRNKNALLGILLGLILISFMFEHMLSRQAGVFFIPLFLAISMRFQEEELS